MFSTSSQRRRWLYDSVAELTQLRCEANEAAKLAFLERERSRNGAETVDVSLALTVEEEALLVKQYSQILLQFCDKFQPKLPPSTIATG